MKLIAYTDGASRGNPGPAAYGFTVEKEGVLLEESCGYIGKETINIAEYRAFIAALTRMKDLGATEVIVYSDSELAVRQINGQYKVKSPGLVALFGRVKALLRIFDSWEVIHVPRGKNSAADGLANQALDEHLK